LTKRLKATIAPAVLVWARTSAGYELEAVANKIGVASEAIEQWEAGNDQPSIPQLRKLAELYKRPLAVMYLPAPPMSFQPMQDFRRLPETGSRGFSPGLTLEIRNAHQRRQLALDLLDEEGGQPTEFTLQTTSDSKAGLVGSAIRDALGVTYDLQSHWRDPLASFRAWRSRIEELGVLVFQASRVEPGEASGFAYWADKLPFIVVNRKDTYSRRTFSLLHELAHLMLHQSGVSDLDEEGVRPANHERIEVFCNQVAAATLMPKALFLSEPVIAEQAPRALEWTDDAISELSVIYGVSREAIVRRLLTFGRTTEAFYRRKRAQYAKEFQYQRERDKAKRGDKGIPRNMPRETVADYGRPFVSMIIASYHADRLSLAEVSGYLGVKVRHVPGIEQSIGLG
jgi:Zn-dependent peptidase ImmA (M78 family)/transcriptional regulator with XRE-family HTH domain